ncbi:MAG: hypothetical protein ACTSU5_18005 [Promethearchaeota archaeon]
MKEWQVSIQFDGSDDIEPLSLVDLTEVTGGYLEIKREFFDELLSSVKKAKNFVVGKKITRVENPDGEDWTNNPWILVLAKVREKKTPLDLLIKRERDLSGTLVAVCPPEFVKFIKANSGEELKKMMEYLISFPMKFEATLILPILPES